jgi:UDP-N-acetyl-2-amino-2-deoxyglucuronate dehydrogenase
MDRLRVGLLGLGTIGATHAAALHELRDRAQLRAFSGSSSGRAAEAGWPDAEQVARDELVRRDDIDIVAICTPSDQHAGLVIAALEAGKHVVVEKPMALTVGEAARIAALAEERGLTVSVIFQRRFEPAHQVIHQLIADGALGRLHLVQTHVHWWRDPEYYDEAPWRGSTARGGSALDNQGTHHVDLVQWLAGPVEAVTAQSATIAHDIEAADTFVATLSFANGALGVFSVSTATPPGFAATITLYFDRGMIEIGPGGIMCWEHEAPRPSLPEVRRAGGTAEPPAVGIENHVAQWRDVLDAIEQGRAPSISAADALQTVRLAAAIARAADTGQRVRPSELA